MRLLILGSTGRCGRWVARLASERGHAVTALSRRESAQNWPEAIRAVQGSVLDRAFLEPLLADHDVAISCLGLRRASILPWARLLSPPNFVESVSDVIATSRAAISLERLIWISAGGVSDSYGQTSRMIRLMIGSGSIGATYRDLARAETRLADSGVRSLAVRPVTLTGGTPTGRAEPVSRYGAMSMIRRSDVATWMLDVADGTSVYDHEHVLLGYASRH